MSAKLRQEQHQLGYQQMIKGDYFKAVDTLKTADSNYGPHVGLLSDLVAVLYALGRVEECQTMTTRLQWELHEGRSLISKESSAKTYIFLGKILEEQGAVAEALKNYSQAAEYAIEIYEVRLRAQAQLLRLQSFLGRRTGLAELYQMCLKSKVNSKNLSIEIQHALILAEMILFGIQHAEVRLKNMMSDKNLKLRDRHLVIIDFIEEALRHKISISSIEEYAKQIQISEADEFEKIIYRMTIIPDFKLSAQESQDLIRKLPPLGILRILLLNLKNTEDSNLSDEIKRMFLFHLEALSTESKGMLLKKWQRDLLEKEALLIYHPAAESLKFKGRSLPIKSGSFAEKCITCFNGRTTVPMEEFAQYIFETSWDPSFYDRSRIAVVRLNKQLSQLTAHPKIFQHKKSSVELQAGFQILMDGKRK